MRVVSLIIAASLTAGLATGSSNAVAKTTSVKAADTQKQHIVVIGASYAKDWPVQQLGGRNVVNRGIGGQESHEIRSRFETDVVAERPHAVIIWGFINDIFRSSPEALPERKEAIKRRVTEMVDLARRNSITPIIATEVTVRGKDDSFMGTVMGWVGKLMGKRSYAENINGNVQEINDWLRQYASANNILLLDFQAVLAEPNGMRKKEYTKDDGSHITPAAYDTLTKYADPQLARAFGATSQSASR